MAVSGVATVTRNTTSFYKTLKPQFTFFPCPDPKKLLPKSLLPRTFVAEATKDLIRGCGFHHASYRFHISRTCNKAQ